MAREDKLKALDAAISQIEKQYGKGSIMKLGDNSAHMNVETIPTGSLSLDIALGLGGLPKGRIIEIFGPESSGKTTLAKKIAKEKEVDKIIPILNLDAEIKLDDVNKEMVDSLKELEPFGEANKMPIFAFRNLKIDSIRSLSEGKHLRLSVKDNKNIINAIGFNMGVLADTYRIGDRVDIAGNLEINSFNGVDSIQINIKDIMKSI